MRTLASLGLIALAGCPAHEPSPLTPDVAATQGAAPPSIPFEHYQLENGLDVILAPDHSTPIVYTNVWYHVGSRDEEPGLTGFAHLFEHLMFQGSANSPGEYFTPLQEIGAVVNGSTSFDRTNYFETVPAQYLPLALFMESDRMGHLLDTLDQAKLDNQREVVRNERRQSYENRPYGEVSKDLYAAAWPEAHPYHHMPIGSHEDLQAADLDAVSGFFHQWYTPNNASLVVAGDFDVDTAKALVAENFGGLPRGPEAQRMTAELLLAVTPQEIRQFDDVPEQKVWLAWATPPFYQPGDADLDLLSSALSGGKDSRLYTRLVKDLQVAKDVTSYQSSMSLGSLFIIQGTAAQGHTTDELVAAVDAVLAEVTGDTPPTQAELDAGRANFEVGFYQNISTISGKGDTLNRYFSHTGDPGFMATDLQRYLDATPETVATAASTWLTKPRVVLHVWPEADRPDDALAPSTATQGGAE